MRASANNHYREFLFSKTVAAHAKDFKVTIRTVSKWRAGDTPSLRYMKLIMKRHPRITFLDIVNYQESKKSK